MIRIKSHLRLNIDENTIINFKLFVLSSETQETTLLNKTETSIILDQNLVITKIGEIF